MNSKITHSQLSTGKPKKTKTNSANNQTRNRITEMEITWKVISGEGEGENGGKGTGNKKHKWQVQNGQGVAKTSMGHGEVKLLTCMIHGPELRGVGRWQDGGCRAEGNEGEKKMRQL